MLNFEIADSGSSLHTQLWIDPVEEFLQYAHTGNPVDVTFGVKELKVNQCPIICDKDPVNYELSNNKL